MQLAAACRANTIGDDPTAGLADNEKNPVGQLQVNGAITTGGVQNPDHITSAEMNQATKGTKSAAALVGTSSTTSSLGSLLNGGSSSGSSSSATGAAATRTGSAGTASSSDAGGSGGGGLFGSASTAEHSSSSAHHAAGASAGGGGEVSGSFSAGRKLLRQAMVKGITAA